MSKWNITVALAYLVKCEVLNMQAEWEDVTDQNNELARY